MAVEIEYEWEDPDFDFSRPSEEGLFRLDDDFKQMLPNASHDEISRIKNMYKSPLCDDDYERFILVSTVEIVKTQTRRDLDVETIEAMSTQLLDELLDMAARWMNDTDTRHSDYLRRREICKFLIFIVNSRNQEMKELKANFAVADHHCDIAIDLLKKYDKTMIVSDLQEAIHQLAIANVNAAVRHPDFLFMFGKLINTQDCYFTRTGDYYYLDTIIDLMKIAEPYFSEPICPKEDPSRAWYFDARGKAHADRYERLGKDEDIDAAVAFADLAVEHKPCHSGWHTMAMNLASWFSRRLRKGRPLDDVDRAVKVGQDSLDRFPKNSKDLPQALMMYATILTVKFDKSGQLKYLQKAISKAELGVKSMDPGDPGMMLWKNNLANLYSKMFDQGYGKKYLDRAIKQIESLARESKPMHYRHDNIVYGNLSQLFTSRFRLAGGNDGDLSAAIEFGERLYPEIAADDPSRCLQFSNLAMCYITLYERDGDRRNLDRAIELATKAFKADNSREFDRMMVLNTLADCLGRRFEAVGALDDLNEAIGLTEPFVKSSSTENRFQIAHVMITHAHNLHLRFRRTTILDYVNPNLDDINRAIELLDKALEILPPDLTKRAGWLGNKAYWLSLRSTYTTDPADNTDLEAAVREAVGAIPARAPHRGFQLTVLAMEIASGGYPEAVRNAIWIGQQALECTPEDHLERSGRVFNMGLLHQTAFKQNNLPHHHKEAVYFFKNSWEHKNSAPSIRIGAGKRLAEMLADEGKWETAAEILHEATLLIPRVSSRMLKSSDKQSLLVDSAGVASMTAAVSLQAEPDAPSKALAALELGRGVIFSQLLDMRTDISQLKAKSRTLAAELEELRNELDGPRPVPPSQREKAEKKLDALLTRIRGLGGDFEDFLGPITEKKLQQLAVRGRVVVINICRYRCDALLVQSGKPVDVQKLDITEREVKEKSKQLRISGESLTKVLCWLWLKVMEPILEKLEITGPPSSDDALPHVWWIPTGHLTNFPLHAAGIHGKKSTATVMHRVISSYSSSIRVLIHGHNKDHTAAITRPPEQGQSEAKAVLVGMKVTPHGPRFSPHRLPFAEKEISMVCKLCPSLGLSESEHKSIKDSVLRAVKSCLIFHFAGHGLSDSVDPSLGCLLLKDWVKGKMTAGDFRDLNLWADDSSPFLAYLSACMTGSNDAEQLIDEGISFVGACHLAGFRHVIGTLWEVSDSHCVDVARVVYETIRDEKMTDESVSRGLHFAIMALREGKIKAEIVKRNDREIPEELVDRDGGASKPPDEAILGSLESDMGRNNARTIKEVKKGYRVVEARSDNPLVWAPYIHVGR